MFRRLSGEAPQSSACSFGELPKVGYESIEYPAGMRRKVFNSSPSIHRLCKPRPELRGTRAMYQPRESAVFVAAGLALQATGVGIGYLGFLSVLSGSSPTTGPLAAMGWGAAIGVAGCAALVVGLFRAFRSLDALAGATRYSPGSTGGSSGAEASTPRVADFG